MSERDADALMTSGKKHVVKTVLKWKPNHTAAASDYEQAAKLYSQLRLKDKCSDAYERAAYEHEKAKNTYFAGKCLEALAAFLSERAAEEFAAATDRSNGGSAKPTDGDSATTAAYFSSVKAASNYYDQAARVYFEDNKLANQADALNKASNLFTAIVKAESRKLPQQRNDTVLQLAQAEYRRYARESLRSLELNWEANEATPFKLPDIYRNFVLAAIRCNDFFTAVRAEKRMLGIVSTSSTNGGDDDTSGGGFSVEKEKYDDSKNLFKRLKQPHNAAKVGLEIVVLILAFNSDYIWANKELDKLSTIEGFRASSEENCARQLVQCYQDRDTGMLAETIKSSGNVLNFMLPDVSRLAKKLTISPTAATGLAAGTVMQQQKQRQAVSSSAAALEAAAGGGPQKEGARASAVEEEEEEFVDPEEDLR